MKTYFVFGDIHSYYELWQEALKEKGFDINNPNHIIISLGDLLDRGSDPLKCLEFVNSLPPERRILIRGNHEDLIEDIFKRGCFMAHDYHNMTVSTIEKLTGFDGYNISDINDMLQQAMNHEQLRNYLSNCINYYELDDNIFVHGWIPVEMTSNNKLQLVKDWRSDKSDWESARWLNGMQMWAAGLGIPNKTIWCGHWHTSWGHANLHGDGKEFLDTIETMYIDPDTGKQEPHANFDPFIDKGIIAMDGCIAYSKQVNVAVIEEL